MHMRDIIMHVGEQVDESLSISGENRIYLFSPEQFHEIPKWLSRTQVFHICRLSRD